MAAAVAAALGKKKNLPWDPGFRCLSRVQACPVLDFVLPQNKRMETGRERDRSGERMRDRGKSQLGFLQKTSLCFSRTISFRETYLSLSLLSFLLSLFPPLTSQPGNRKPATSCYSYNSFHSKMGDVVPVVRSAGETLSFYTLAGGKQLLLNLQSGEMTTEHRTSF